MSFATELFYSSQSRLSESALSNGIDKTFSYSGRDIYGSDFFIENRDILSNPKGAGYWLWKPYLILETLKVIEDDAMLVYSDSDIEIRKSLNPLFQIWSQIESPMFFKVHEHLNRAWTKRDCFVLMDCDGPEYWDAEQTHAGFCLFQNNQSSRNFAEEWLSFCVDERVISDNENTCGLDNLPEFIAHRHDQSVLSLLVKKHRIETYRDHSQRGNRFIDKHSNSPYSQLTKSYRVRVDVLPVYKRWSVKLYRFARRYRVIQSLLSFLKGLLPSKWTR